MLINLGRLLMLFVWAFLILNLVQPFPRPLNIFVNVALVFMALMHGMQLALLKSTIPKRVADDDGRKSAFSCSACLSCWSGRRSLRTKNNVCCRMTVYSLSGVRLTNPTNRVPL